MTKANELIGQRIEGNLNGELGTVIEATDPKPGTQGTGIDMLIRWDAPELEDDWNNAGDVDFV